MIDERTKEYKSRWNNVICDLHNAGKGIRMDIEYFSIVKVLVGNFIKGISLTNSEAKLVLAEITKRENELKTLE